MDFARTNDACKIRLFLSKFDAEELEMYTATVRSQNSCELTFDDTIDHLSDSFRRISSSFSVGYRCLKAFSVASVIISSYDQ